MHRCLGVKENENIQSRPKFYNIENAVTDSLVKWSSCLTVNREIVGSILGISSNFKSVLSLERRQLGSYLKWLGTSKLIDLKERNAAIC